MTSFARSYTKLLTVLGRPPAPDAGIPEREIKAAERRLGVRAPAAVRDL